MGDCTFLVVGCGAVGMLYTYVLSRKIAEPNIYAVCRSNAEIASKQGFTIHSQVWGPGLNVKPTVVKSIDEAVERNGATFDYIIVSTKSLPPISRMIEMIAPAVSPGITSIALFQNGINIEDAFFQAYQSNPIISVVVYVQATETARSVVQHSHGQHLHMGTYPSSAPTAHKESVKRLAHILTTSGTDVTIHDDVQTERWSKALVNTVWNPLCALTKLTDGAFLACDEQNEELVRTLMRETAAIARACGIRGIDDKVVEFQLKRNIARKPIGQYMSMFFDAQEERTMEVDAIIGNVIALGQQHQVSTPSLSLLYRLIKGLNASFAKKQ